MTERRLIFMMKSAIKIFAALSVLALTFGVSYGAVTSANDLKAAKVGVQNGSLSEALVRGFVGNDAANVKTFEGVYDMIEALRSGDIEAAVMDETPARFFVIGSKELKILPQTMATEYYAIAFRKGSSLRSEVDKALDELIAEKVIAGIMAKYLDGEEAEPSAIDFNKGAEGGKLWVGCAASFPPYEERTSEGFIGIDVEICAAIAKKLNRELVIADYRFDMLPEALAEGKIDMICSAFSVTEERMKTMDFSKPYDANQEVIVVLAEEK